MLIIADGYTVPYLKNDAFLLADGFCTLTKLYKNQNYN